MTWVESNFHSWLKTGAIRGLLWERLMQNARLEEWLRRASLVTDQCLTKRPLRPNPTQGSRQGSR